MSRKLIDHNKHRKLGSFCFEYSYAGYRDEYTQIVLHDRSDLLFFVLSIILYFENSTGENVNARVSGSSIGHQEGLVCMSVKKWAQE